MAFFNYRRFDDYVAEGEGPSVYMVDTQTSRPPLPPRLNHKPKRSSCTQTLPFLLVGLVLCGLVIEACFIYYLHQPDAAPSPVSYKQTGGPQADQAVDKPLAHLTGGRADGHDNILAWDLKAEPVLKQISYEDRSLIIERAGHYYVYSKVFFKDSGTFYHCIEKRSQRYELPVTLLQNRKYSPESDFAQSNSFLGGVFYFNGNDAVYVNVSKATQIVQYMVQENVFGAYMI